MEFLFWLSHALIVLNGFSESLIRVESSFPLRRVSWLEDPEETRETSRWNLDLFYFARTLIIPKRSQIVGGIFIFAT